MSASATARWRQRWERGILSRREYSQKARHRPDIHLNLNIRGMRPSATVAINEQSNRLIAEGRRVFKLGLGQSPFPVPHPVVEASLPLARGFP